MSGPEIKREIEEFAPELQDEIERLAGTTIRVMPSSALMRSFYRTYRWRPRYQSTRHWLFAVAALNLLCAIADPFIVGPDHLGSMLAARALISLVFVLGSVPLHRQRSARVEALCVIIPCVILLLTTGVEGLSEDAMMLERYVVNACFVIATAVVLLRIDSRYMSALVVMTCVIMSTFIFMSHIQPAMSKIEIVGFHVGAMITLFKAHWAQSIYRYRSVILSLHNEIQTRKMKDMNEVLVGIAQTDPLTGIANRRHFDEMLSKLDPDGQIAILMIDIDHFKALNDTCGHAEGDRCLRLVARTIRDEVRVDDLAARFGGEEFAVLLRNCEPGASAVTAEHIRSAVSMLDIRRDGSRITVSLGAVEGRARNVDTMIEDADVAMYKAKHQGRNCVVNANETALCA